MRQRARPITALCAGAIAAFAFLALSVTGLDRQGMYYDEIHQAPAAFFYIGERPGMFTYPVFGVPVLNMGYSGAIKSTLYGLYLRFIGGHFTVYSWRLLGLLFVAVGLFVFYRTAGIWLPAWSSMLFGALFLTDTSVILMSRHDWGPVALSLGLRLALLGLWVSLAWKPAPASCFLAGLIVGIALFEKLSAFVLLLPFGLLLWSVRARLSRALKMASLGFGLGVLPLVFVNLASYKRGTGLISLVDVKSFKTIHLQDALNYAREYLVLGQGAGVRGLVLGDYVSFSGGAELILMLILLVLVIAGVWRQPQDPWRRLAGGFAASYILIATALFLMPQETSVHHWILGTPFQYGAVAASLAGFSAAILQAAVKAPGWQEAPVEQEFAELRQIQVRRFVRRTL